MGLGRRRRYSKSTLRFCCDAGPGGLLHREWRALRPGRSRSDVPGFAMPAVSALRVGSAPHFPRTRALVGSDVLPIASQLEMLLALMARRLQLRRFFTATDSSRFAIAPEGVTNLLVLQPEIERVLEELETKL